MFDISNPAAPVDLGPGAQFPGRAIDIAGQASSPVTSSGGGLVAISAGMAMDNPIPGNIWLYDVSSPTQPNRVGAVSVSSDAAQGIALRLFMKDQYLYTSTFLQGLQVIDLSQALTEYQQVNSANPTQFGQAVSTIGNGFAMDAIMNTIQLPLSSGGMASMLDLKADNFAINGGGTQTLLVAAGELPFLMADPTLSGASAVLYPPSSGGTFSANPVQPLLMTSLDGQTNNLLCHGQALDLGTIPVLGADGSSSSEHIAVVVGNGISGPAGSTTSCTAASSQPVLAVVNISQAYTSGSQLTPQLVGFLPLPVAATDITLNGSVALVSTGTNILLINLEDPTQPTLAGQITGSFGNWLSLTSSGFMITTPTNGSNTGLQTATSQAVVYTECPGPILSTLISGSATQNPIYQTIQPVNCTVRVVPAGTPATSASVSFTQTSLGSPFTVALTQGVGQLQIPANTRITGAVMNAQSSAVNWQTKQAILGLTQAIPVGSVHIVVDSDNDSNIDPVKDSAAAQAGKTFPFWQADPTNKGNNGQDGLLDYAPLRVYVNALPPSTAGSIQLALTSPAGAASWVLTQNLGVLNGATDTIAAKNEKLYLKDQATATAELGLTWNSTTGSFASGLNCGAASGNSFTKNLCASQNGLIELPNLTSGTMYDLLFSCLTCADTTQNGTQSSAWILQVLLVAPNGTRTVLDQVPVDIRPLKNWMSVYTVRHDDAAVQNQLPPGDDCTTQYRPIPTALADTNWAPVPNQTGVLTILVHGFNVDKSSAEQNMFPPLLKKLYWAGHPVIGTVPGETFAAHVVGFEWPGNSSSKYSTPLLFFPVDEMHALESGVPFAKLVSLLADNPGKPRINVLAHSLGNMVVNSALTRSELSDHAIDTYVMNDAAVASEALVSTGDTLDSGLVGHASNFGFPADQLWESYWSLNPSLGSNWLRMMSDSRIKMLNGWRPRYCDRWRQQRTGVPADAAPGVAASDPSTEIDCSISDFSKMPQRGPWSGFFSGNVTKTKIVNTYNTGDKVLNWVWKTALQNLQKPYTGAPLGIFGSLTTQVWAFPEGFNSCEQKVFGTGGNHMNIIRQWSELASWFPAVSNASGAGVVPGTANYSFDYAATGANPLDSHSYLMKRPLSITWCAFKSITSEMDGSAKCQ